MPDVRVDGLVTRDASGHVTGVDHAVYRDERLYRLELDRIFGRTWVLLGIELEIPKPGDYVTTHLGETPVLLLRDEHGRIRAFENVCAHRGARVMQGTGNCQALQCMYHQWTYDLQGRLTGVPMEDGYGPGFRREEYGLPALPRVETFAGLIFASYNPAVEPLARHLGEIGPHLTEMLRGGAVEFQGYHRYRVKGNWKLFVENSIDAYHAGLLHLPIQRSASEYNYKRASGRNYKFAGGHGMIQWPLTVSDRPWRPTEDLPILRCLSRREGWNRSLSLFPNATAHEIEDILTVRKLIPRGVGAVDVVAYNFALAGEPEEIKRNRAWMVSSQFGIAGVVSADDKVAIEEVQKAATARYSKTILLRGALDRADGDVSDEYSLRGYYEAWAALMSA